MTIEQSSEVHPWVKEETGLGRSRFVTQGSDANDVDDTLSAMRTIDDWIEGWSASGAVHEALAEKAEADGLTVTAGGVTTDIVMNDPELRATAAGNELTRSIDTFLFHEDFPVDTRHNAKIFREKLAVWAASQLS